jgi:hypothetical protein
MLQRHGRGHHCLFLAHHSLCVIDTSILNLHGYPFFPFLKIIMSDDNNEDERNETTEEIMDMLKEAGVSTQSLEDNKEHKFWDTQVRNNEVVISSLFRS